MLFGWEWTVLKRDAEAGGNPCKYHIYVRMWDGRVIQFDLVFKSHRDFYTWMGGMYANAVEKIERIDYSREVLNSDNS